MAAQVGECGQESRGPRFVMINKAREQEGKEQEPVWAGSGSLEETKIITSSKKLTRNVRCKYLCLSMYIYLETEREERTETFKKVLEVSIRVLWYF